MLMILMALVVLALFAVAMFVVAASVDSFAAFTFGCLSAVAASLGLFIYAILGWDYLAAEYKADIINREYGTSYTQQEVFWASGVIDTIRELDRKRVELNGDLIAGDRAREEQEQ